MDHFGVRWTGVFVPPTSDDYKFYISADDGVRLYLNDDLVIDDWHRHAETLNTYSTRMEAGKTYKIKLEYFENVGSAAVRFGIAGSTQTLGEETKKLVAQADAVVLCMGFDANSESEGGDRTFGLPGGQDGYIEQVASANKNVIVVLTAGGNVEMTRWIDKVPALLHTWYPGQEGGTALAQILFGAYSPSGKLPATFEKRWEDNPTYHSYYPAPGTKVVDYSEGVFVGYRGYEHNGVKPMFPVWIWVVVHDVCVQRFEGGSGEPGWRTGGSNVCGEEYWRQGRRGDRAGVCGRSACERAASAEGVERICESKFAAGRDEASHDNPGPARIFLLRRKETRLECGTG